MPRATADPPSAGTAGAILERAARALPAAQTVAVGGWRLRYDPGAAWWVSAVLPHAGGTVDGGSAIDDDGYAVDEDGYVDGDLPARITAAERFYRHRGVPTRFQISPAAWPPGLDDALARRGYRRQTPVLLLSADAGTVGGRLSGPPPADLVMRVEVVGSPTESWLRAWSAVQAEAGDVAVDLAVERQLLHRVTQASGYATAIVDGEVAAVGRAVADSGWAGVFGMATRPHARGQGAGRAVLAALANWAAGVRARHLYLQVEPGNQAARRLYDRAGFQELCRYHYRTAAAGVPGRSAHCQDGQPAGFSGS